GRAGGVAEGIPVENVATPARLAANLHAEAAVAGNEVVHHQAGEAAHAIAAVLAHHVAAGDAAWIHEQADPLVVLDHAVFDAALGKDSVAAVRSRDHIAHQRSFIVGADTGTGIVRNGDVRDAARVGARQADREAAHAAVADAGAAVGADARAAA